MAPIAHLHQETGILPLSAHLGLACDQFLASALQPSHASFHMVSAPLGDRSMKASIRSKLGQLVTPLFANGILLAGAYGEAKRSLCREIASLVAATEATNAVLAAPPPPIASVETSLPRSYRSALTKLRSGYCSSLAFYSARIGRSLSSACSECGDPLQSVQHLFACSAYPRSSASPYCGTAPWRQRYFWQPSLLSPISHFFRCLPPPTTRASSRRA
jgi:hypothetical protein